MKSFKFVAIVLFLFSAASYAGTCEIKVTRTACPGKEELSY